MVLGFIIIWQTGKLQLLQLVDRAQSRVQVQLCKIAGNLIPKACFVVSIGLINQTAVLCAEKKVFAAVVMKPDGARKRKDGEDGLGRGEFQPENSDHRKLMEVEPHEQAGPCIAEKKATAFELRSVRVEQKLFVAHVGNDVVQGGHSTYHGRYGYIDKRNKRDHAAQGIHFCKRVLRKDFIRVAFLTGGLCAKAEKGTHEQSAGVEQHHGTTKKGVDEHVLHKKRGLLGYRIGQELDELTGVFQNLAELFKDGTDDDHVEEIGHDVEEEEKVSGLGLDEDAAVNALKANDEAKQERHDEQHDEEDERG